MSVSQPLISVIVCTHDRPETLPRAIGSVLQQEFNDFEIIVVDDSSDERVQLPFDLLNRVRLVLGDHRGVGAARSTGLRAARGTFIAYCDDDDFWFPNHLSALYGYLQDHPDVDLVYGDSEWLEEEESSGAAYSIDYDGHLLSQANYVFASDVLHRASAARDVGGFDASLQAFEDWDLWLRMSQAHVIRHHPVIVGGHRWNAGCVSAGEHWEDWERVYRDHQARLSRSGSAAQHDLTPAAARVAPFDPSTWQEERRQLVWHSLLRVNEGYGTLGRELLLAAECQGIDITMAPTRNQAPPGFERFYRPLESWGRLGFYCDYRVLPSVLPCEKTVNYSMWESTLVPREHVEEINKAAILQFVPCQQNLESFRECGVRVPIKVLHLGVHSERFPYLDRHHPNHFTFGTFGDLSPRKGIDVLIRAFEDEFAQAEMVRLIMKSSSPAAAYNTEDPRIVLVSGFMDQAQLLDFLRQMDVFILPSRGEGFGLCALEAMSTGLPVIATNWSGPTEYLDQSDSFPLSYRLVDVVGTASNHVRYFGQWAEPDYEHLRNLMRWLYEHPNEAAEKGRLAAGRVQATWTWDRVARQMRHDLDAAAMI